MSGDPAAGPDAPVPDLDRDAGARGAVYGLLARAFEHPGRELYDRLADGTLGDRLGTLVGLTPLDVAVPALRTGDDLDTLCARFNDLFVVGRAEYVDRTDGTLSAAGPPVAPYESAYREDASWRDVNLDLARAYDHFGLAVAGDERRNHDHLRLELEFAGYLARREAAVDPAAADARLDFHDRHLRHLADGVADRLADEPGTGVYGDLGGLLAAFVASDAADLGARREGRP